MQGLNYDFGELRPASLSGHVYADDNRNGVKDAGESPIAGVKLTLLDSKGNPTGTTAITDATGYYLFAGLEPDTSKIFHPVAGRPLSLQMPRNSLEIAPASLSVELITTSAPNLSARFSFS